MELFIVFLVWIYHLQLREAAIIEKTTSVCNGECSNLVMQCPSGHKIAIREALYGVHSVSSPCPYKDDCDDSLRDVCCEMSPGRDCLFPYPLDHLETFHRDCSGRLKCNIRAEQRPEASEACSPVEHRNISSYSMFDYVCINDSFTADLCSPRMVSLRGRTLFAMFDVRREKAPPPGSVCACAATPVSKKPNSRISAFVVDMRLNKPKSLACSDSDLIMEAHPNLHTITCLATHEPYFPYPFVSILNSTSGALARIVFNKAPPEFIWIGFEASKDDEVQLTCGLQSVPSTTPDPVAAPPNSTGSNGPANIEHARTEPQPKGDYSLQSVAIACGVIGGLVVVGVIVLLALWLYRRRHLPEKPPSVSADSTYDEHMYTDVDGSNGSRCYPQPATLEPVYHTVGSGNPVGDVYSSPWDSKKNRKFKNNNGFAVADDDSDELSDMYVSSEVVRQNKPKKKPRNSLSPEDANSDEYVSVTEIRRKKREKKVTFNNILEEYDRLNYSRKEKESGSTPPGYSHLGIVVTDYDEELDTTLRQLPTVPERRKKKKTAENGGRNHGKNAVEEEVQQNVLNIDDSDGEDVDGTGSKATRTNDDDDSGLSTEEEPEASERRRRQRRRDVKSEAPVNRAPSPSMYALAKSFSNST